MAESYRGFVIQVKQLAPRIGSVGSEIKTRYVAYRNGEQWKVFQSMIQAKHAIDLQIAVEDEEAQLD